MPNHDLIRALKQANVSVIGVGQGHQSENEAAPKQAAAIRLAYAEQPTTRHVYKTVDTDGERGVMVVPKFRSRVSSAFIGDTFGQRSVLHGKMEVATEDASILTQFGHPHVSEHRPEGFYTYVPDQGLYYSLVPVRSYRRGGRPVAGYATRRRVRSRR